MTNRFNILENLFLDVWEILDNLVFDYQHSPNYSTNPKAFSNKNDTGDWVMSCCPNHPENRPSFGISKEAPYHANCFYCGYLGTIDRVIELAFDLDKGEGLKFLLTDYLVEEKRSKLDVDRIIDEGRLRLAIPTLDENVLSKFDNAPERNNWEYRVALSYMIKERGIHPHTLEKYEIKVDLDNKCIVFPQRTRTGELRFLQKRKIGERFTGAKFINEGSPIKKDILFGLHHINKLRYSTNRIRRIRLVESPIDVLSNYQVGVPAVALNGKILFVNQIRELQLAGIEEVDLFLDNDSAGRQATREATEKLIKAGFIVNHCLYPKQVAHDYKQDSNTLLRLGLLDQVITRNVSLLGNLT